MDFAFLPEKIKLQLAELESGSSPLCTIRGSGGFCGEPGESYIIPYDGSLYLFNRSFGAKEYNARKADFSDITGISLNKDQFSSVLTIVFGTENISLKLSCIEVQNAAPLFEHAEKFPSIKRDYAEAVNLEKDFTPLAGLAACLMFVSAADGKISEDENSYILNKICSGNEDIYNAAAKFYETRDFSALLQKLQLDQQQKLCFFAQMLELAMSDGVFDRAEQKLIDTFAAQTGISNDESETVRNVLLIKNQLSVLS